MDIPQKAEYIIDELMKHGYEAYVVGGCVRDMVLGRTPGDWDITTSATPYEVKSIFKRTIDTGIQHGTVTVMLDKEGFEVTTYRIDGEYEDSRHPKEVKFTANLVEDLKRRDFTINAMAYNPVTGLVDEFEGIKDLERGQIRCVGVAEERFGEDALRILRAVRFSAQLGFRIEESTCAAATKLAPNLRKISRERILAELTKLLVSDNPDYIIQIDRLYLKEYMFAENIIIDEVTLRMLKNVRNDKILRFAAFLQHEETAALAHSILRGLKADNHTTDYVTKLIKWLRMDIKPCKADIRKAVCMVGEDIFPLLLELKTAFCESCCADDTLKLSDVKKISELYEEIRLAGDCITLKGLKVTGSDIKEAGLACGKGIGELLSYLLNAVHEEPHKNDRRVLMELAADYAAGISKS